MSSLPVFVGLDYHDREVRVCVLDEQGRTRLNRSVPNDASALARLVRQYGRVAAAAIESCSGAADLADELATREHWPIDLAHPGYVARVKRGPDKTDLGDARLLADLVRVRYLPKVWLAPYGVRQLRRLVRHRQRLVDQRRSVKLRMRALLRDNRIAAPQGMSPWTKRYLAWLEQVPLGEDDRWLMAEHLGELDYLKQRIGLVEQRLTERTADDPVVAQLLTFAGVGLVTAVTLRAEIGRFDRFDTGRQLARFASVTPCNRSSGQRQADSGLVKAGNANLRRVLIELAHRMLRGKNRFSHLAYQMLRRGKPKNVVVAAIANRWMRWLFHQMRQLDLGSGSANGGPAAPAAVGLNSA